MTKLFLIGAAALGIVTSPVVAREARPAAATGTSDSTTARSQQAPQKYCVVSTVTGSRIEHKVCKTRAEWLAEGFDPTAKD